MESKSLFVFGICGYVGSRLAKHCVEELGGEFAEVSGTVPHHHAASSTSFPLTEHGELSNEAKAALERATHVLSVVPTQGDFTLEDGLVQRKAQQGQLKWAGYLSTTGVYGDRAGGLVFEEDECDAISARGKARVKMEQKWRETGAPVHVFRLPSIYGPGRRSLSKRPFLIHKPGQVFCRIHVEDLVQILVLSMRSPNPGRIYNCCDDEPAAPHEVSLFSYHLHQLPAPPAVDYASIQHELSDMERSFYLECKRITNHRVKMELGFVPKFPTYRQGLAHDAAAEFSEGQGNPTPVSQRGRPKPAPLAPVWQTWWYSHARPWLNKWWFAARWKLVRLWYWCLRKPVVLLVDNGSVREEPTIGMQRLAKALERRLGGWPVRACSWNHVDETQPSRPVLFSRRLVEFSMGRMVIVPLFLGPSAICVRDMPKLLSRSSQTIASTLVDLQQPAGECLVTKMLLQAIGPAHSLVKIVLVDHGSPNVAVNYVRRALAARVRAQLPPTARVVDCSMERRPGAQYAFNDPLLEHVFDLGGFDSGLVLVVPIFLFPGNHAGEGGDIAQILRRVRERHNSGQ
ncbi:hypothetical protein BASA81_012105 [Batrachochytrium salamandrivorans]|nr:hypothetical protein BASA81_012105 [Batrachochytrium salamandrivorans]